MLDCSIIAPVELASSDTDGWIPREEMRCAYFRLDRQFPFSRVPAEGDEVEFLADPGRERVSREVVAVRVHAGCAPQVILEPLRLRDFADQATWEYRKRKDEEEPPEVRESRVEWRQTIEDVVGWCLSRAGFHAVSQSEARRFRSAWPDDPSPWAQAVVRLTLNDTSIKRRLVLRSVDPLLIDRVPTLAEGVLSHSAVSPCLLRLAKIQWRLDGPPILECDGLSARTADNVLREPTRSIVGLHLSRLMASESWIVEDVIDDGDATWLACLRLNRPGPSLPVPFDDVRW